MPGALRAIYDAEAPAMLGVAMRLWRRRALAEEAVHDAFVQVWQRAASFDPARGEAKAWLYAVPRHRALNIRRDEVRTELSDDIETFEVPNGEESAEAMVLRLSETDGAAPLPRAPRAGASQGDRPRLSRRPQPQRARRPPRYSDWHGENRGFRRSLLALRDCLE